MPEINKGDVVELKSGGPEMTVNEFYDRSETIECVWFVGAEVKYGKFAKESVKKVQK